MTTNQTTTVEILRLSGLWHSGRGDEFSVLTEPIQDEAEASRPLNCGGKLLAERSEDSET